MLSNVVYIKGRHPMDFLEIHSLLLREPNLLLLLLDLSNINKNNSNFCQVKVLKNHQDLILTDSCKLIHVVKGQMLSRIKTWLLQVKEHQV